MTPRIIAAMTGAAAVACTLAITAPAHAQPSNDAPSTKGVSRPDNRPGPKTADQTRKRAKALELLKSGKAQLKSAGRRWRHGRPLRRRQGDVVEFPVDKTRQDLHGARRVRHHGLRPPRTGPGPLHNQIPQPDRDAWTTRPTGSADFNQAHYEQMFNGSGESFADFYIKLSTGKYTAINTVSDWVKVPGNASTLRRQRVEDVGGSWAFVGRLRRRLVRQGARLGQDRGRHRRLPLAVRRLGPLRLRRRRELQRARRLPRPLPGGPRRRRRGGGGAGDDAIWSHRWYAYGTSYGTTGPTVSGSAEPLGGAQVGGSEVLRR